MKSGLTSSPLKFTMVYAESVGPSSAGEKFLTEESGGLSLSMKSGNA